MVVEESTNRKYELGSDLPLVNPAEDAFGYAPFAAQLAAAIVGNNSPQGLVLAVHGKWGSGKSTLLNFIKHDLTQLPEERRPIVVDFNPWWFEGREQIASQLLAEFSSQLPDRLQFARQTAILIGKYSKEIAGAAATVSGHAWISMPVAWLAERIPKLKAFVETKGVPGLKRKVAEALRKTGRRFVFFIDDIDRLTPDEARDFFRAIKALADFPEVVYVLFFDRDEVAKALSAALQMDGEKYLEKIVQAPFHLPAVGKEQLHNKLFSGLDAILDSKPQPFPFDRTRWAEVFSTGLDHFIRKPRDIVRVLNAVSVSYPPLVGEVNPVDLIALEFLRVFEQGAYDSIREARTFFSGTPAALEHMKADEKRYFEKWRESLPESSRDQLVLLIGRLFPKVAQVLGNGYIFSDDSSEWQRELRPCSPSCVDVYFQFGVPPGHVSRAELDRLVAQETPEGIAALMIEVKGHIFPDGHSKARDLIDRLRDFDELDVASASTLIEALVSNGHMLLRDEDEQGGFFVQPNRWRINSLIVKLLDRLVPSERQELLARLAEESPGLWCLVAIADDGWQVLLDSAKAMQVFLELDKAFLGALTKKVGIRLNKAGLDELLVMPELDFIVHRWSQWGDLKCIRDVFKPMVDRDDQLLLLLDKFVRIGRMSSGRETTLTYHLAMKPLGFAVDLHAIEPRIRDMQQSRTGLSERQRATINRFIKGFQRMAEGKDPDGLYADDDE